ncbi:MAG: tetratricopeptide repeat protein [Spirochaetales bacterium]|nr:tetratricopeptide repeat protein [Spirochaetales bacterium]
MLFTKAKYRQALNDLAMGEYTKAEELFRRILKSAPSTQGAGHNLAVCLMAQERYDEAEEFFLREIEALGECFSRSIALGDLYFTWGKRKSAEEWYGKSLEECPGPTIRQFLKKRIVLCRSEEKFADAMEGFSLMKQGKREVEAGEFDKAIESFELAFEKDPTQYQSLNEAGVLLMNHKKEYRRAREHFKTALKLSDLSPIRKNLELAENIISLEEK